MSQAQFVAAVLAGQHAQAIKLLDTSITALQGAGSQESAKQELCNLYTNRGACNARLQLYRKALKDYDLALNLKPSSVEALYQKGIVLQALKREQEAQQCWQSALECATFGTDLTLIQALQEALSNPISVLARVDRLSFLWAMCTRTWLLALLAVLVIILACCSTQHTFKLLSQPPITKPDVVAAGNVAQPHMPPRATAVSNAPAQADGGSISHPATPPNTDIRSTGSNSNVGNSSIANTRTDDIAASKSAPPARSSVAAPQVVTTGSAAATPADKTSSGSKDRSEDNVLELDCAAQQQAKKSGLQGGFLQAPRSTATAGNAGSSQPSRSSASGASGSRTGGTGRAGTQAATASITPESANSAAAQLTTAAAIQAAVAQINAGHVTEAEALLDSLLSANPKELGALVARGTARALRRELKGAIQDFSAAIDIEPRYADTWKRRGQARSAVGETDGALTDLQKAIELLPLWNQDSSVSQAECYVEKGLVYHKLRDYQKATRELKQAVKFDPRNHQAWNMLGLSSTSQGDLRDGVRAYEKAVELKPDFKEAWFNMAQARKEAGLINESEAAFARLLALEGPDKVNVPALKVMSQMKQQAGQHWAAISLLDKALAAAKDDALVVDLHFLRAICYHALGLVQDAVQDYEACLAGPPPRNAASHGSGLPDDTRSLQYLSFYQKELALYLYHSLDRRADSFCPDVELSAPFKEQWCKKAPPTAELIATYSPQPSITASNQSPAAVIRDSKAVQQLTAVADQLGALLQNNHQGFMSNARQQRAAGFAAIELAQAMHDLIKARRQGNTLWVHNTASSAGHSSASSSSGRLPIASTDAAGREGQHVFGWRDAMDIVVKWRQLAEPNDQVLWVDLLTRREFEQGFGSHTPIYSGQTKCVRYYMNFDRALALHKQVLLKEGHAFDAQNRHVPCGGQHQQDSIHSARTCDDMYSVLQSDSWVVIPIASMSRPGHNMEGTRLTLVKAPNQPNAYEFSIRTPVTPPRWQDFDQELQAAWENVVAALAAEPVDYPAAAQAIMVYTYYWYNFMPLARGTAACGYTTLLSLFWAAGMPVSVHIPKDVQVDWEAILSQHPLDFINAIKSWLLPAQAHGEEPPNSAPGTISKQARPASNVADLPLVSEHLATLRQRLEALNPPGVPKL